MTWMSRARAAELEEETNGSLMPANDDFDQARLRLITDCGFGPRVRVGGGIGEQLGERARERSDSTNKGYIDCEWGRLLEENSRPKYHPGMVPIEIGRGTNEKPYIDCGWGRLLESNSDRWESAKIGHALLGRRPIEE